MDTNEYDMAVDWSFPYRMYIETLDKDCLVPV